MGMSAQCSLVYTIIFPTRVWYGTCTLSTLFFKGVINVHGSVHNVTHAR